MGRDGLAVLTKQMVNRLFAIYQVQLNKKGCFGRLEGQKGISFKHLVMIGRK